MDKSVRVGIVTGIIASMVFVYFLDPIIRVFGEGVLYFSELLVTGLVDSLYQKSALGVAKDPALSTYSFLVGIVFGMPVAILSIVIRKRKISSGNDDRAEGSKLKKWIAITPLIVMPVMLFYQFWLMVFQYQVVTSFDQHMRILAPYIELEERILFRSKFASMQKEEDYKNIYRELEGIAEKHDLTLPENPSYSFWAI